MFGTTEKLLFNLLSENNVMFGIKVIFDFRIKNHLMSEIYLCMGLPTGGGGGWWRGVLQTWENLPH